MACVPPQAGYSTARQFPIAQGVPLSKHGKMKQIFARSSLWYKSCRGWPPVRNVRNIASQAVVVEDMEASEVSEGSEKKTMRWQRWKAHETTVLIAAKKQQDLRGVESTEAAGVESKKTKNKWKEIEAICREKGIERSAQQCQARWSRLTSAFTQIRSWEETRKPEQPSFWSLNLDERKTMGFLPSLDQKTYNALDELYNIKADAVENALAKNDVEEVVELGSITQVSHVYDKKNCNNADKADVNCSRVQGKAHEVNNKIDSPTSGYKSDEMVQAECLNISKPICEENNEQYVRDAEDNFISEELKEFKGEKQADRSKAMESTKILSEYLKMVVDDSNEAQLLHSNAGMMDCNPANVHTGQHEESLEVSGIAEQKDVNGKAQLLSAGAELNDGSNKDLCQGSLVVVDDKNKDQLLHASAGKVDCNLMNHHTGQHAESSKVYEIAEHTNPMIWCDQKDANGKSQLLPASVEMIDGSNKDSCRGSLEEHGAEENTIVMHCDDDNSQFSCVLHDGTMQAPQGEGIEKGVDGRSSETSASVTDSLVARGLANANSVSASVEESYECNIHLSSTGVDVLNASQSRRIAGTALRCISIDKQDCRNLSEDTSLAEEACIDKEKGKDFSEVCEDKYPLCPKSAEDIPSARADSIQSNSVEAQNKNDASETVDGTVAQLKNLVPIVEEAYLRSEMVLHARPEQQQGCLNPLLASTEEIGTGVLKQVPEDDCTFPRSEIFGSICSARDKGSEKIELQPSEEGHVEMIADMAERSATMLGCSTTSFEEKKVGHMGDGNNEYNEKTTEPSQNIQHFEVAVKDADSYVKREPRDQSQSVYDEHRSDAIERMKVDIKEGEYLTEKVEIRGSTVDANPPVHRCIQHQFQHAGSASEKKSTIKGDGGSFESACEAKEVEVFEVAAKELEFTIKDDRGSPVTLGKGSKEDQSQKTTTSSKAHADVFLYIPAATGNLVRSAVESVRKFFKF